MHSQSLSFIRPHSAGPARTPYSVSPASRYTGTLGTKPTQHAFLNPCMSGMRGTPPQIWPNQELESPKRIHEHICRFNQELREKDPGPGIRLSDWTHAEIQKMLQDKLRERTAGKGGPSFEAFKQFCQGTCAPGAIDFQQFYATLNRMFNICVSQESAKLLFDAYDADGGGEITLDELVAGMQEQEPPKRISTPQECPPQRGFDPGVPAPPSVQPSHKPLSNWVPPPWCTVAHNSEPVPDQAQNRELTPLPADSYWNHRRVAAQVQQHQQEQEQPRSPKARPKSARVCRQMERMKVQSAFRTKPVVPLAPSKWTRG